MGWIATYGSRDRAPVQISFMTEGGSGTPVPDVSIEVADLDTVLARVRRAKLRIEYGPAHEPWGVRRFFVRDPFGKLVNILARAEATPEATCPCVRDAVPTIRSAEARSKVYVRLLGERRDVVTAEVAR